jgi:hypothetical protein
MPDDNTPAAAPEQPQETFADRLAEYERLRAISEAMPLGTPGEDQAIDDYCDAIARVFEAPAPTLQAVRQKLKLASEWHEGFSLPDDVMELIDADLESPDVDALQAFALAWIDRFRALGGTFCRMRDRDLQPLGVAVSMPMPYTWTPPTQHNPDLQPHLWITEEEDHNGAQKMLFALLKLMPGGREAVLQTADTIGLVLGEGDWS